MVAVRPAFEPLVGSVVRLEPLTREQLPALYRAIGHPQVFGGGFGGGPAAFPATEERFLDWAERYFDWSANTYAVILTSGPDAGSLVGTSTLADFDEKNEAAHIGWTAYDPRVWGTAVNPQVKRLMLGLAFDSGFHRVKLQADALNERSRSAILRLGATFEGVLRRDRPRADGSWRDSAVYSILDDEWPAIRERLDARVSAAGQPRLRDGAARLGESASG